MKHSNPPKERLTAKDIEALLRQRIVSGKWPPGTRIPTRVELAVEFNSSNATIQMALAKLIENNFVESRSRAGTFVVDHPPHQSRIALCVPHDASSDKRSSMMWQAVEFEASGMKKTGVILDRYYDTGRLDSDGTRRLLDDIKYHRLAGLIAFASPILDQLLAARTRAGSILRVAATPEYPIPGVIRIQFEPFIEKMFAYLVARGKKRPACLWTPPLADYFENDWKRLASQYGLPYDPNLSIEAYPAHAMTVQILARLLVRQTPEFRPDSLLIFDDHFVQSATLGAYEGGVRSVEDLLIIAHTNFPILSPASIPVTRIGYDFGPTLSRVVDLMLKPPSDEELTRGVDILIPGRFESEVTPNNSLALSPGAVGALPHP